MADGVRIRLDGLDETLATLGRAAGAMDDATPLYDEIGAAMVLSTQQRFENSTGPGGSPWPASIRAQTEGGKTLIDSTRLLASITHIPGPNFVEIGTNVLYAAVHQLGAVIKAVNFDNLTFKIGDQFISKPEVTIPARPFLGIDDDDESEILAIIRDWLEGPEVFANAN